MLYIFIRHYRELGGGNISRSMIKRDHNITRRLGEKMNKRKSKLQIALAGLLLFAAVLFCAGRMTIQTAKASDEDEVPLTVFKDDFVRSFISYHFDEDGNGSLSTAEIAIITSLTFDDNGVTTLEGIEVLTNLKALYVSRNPLKTLDLSGNPNLEKAYCDFNPNLKSVNARGNAKLTRLDCSNCNLTELLLEGNVALTNLHCENNPLALLDLSKVDHFNQMVVENAPLYYTSKDSDGHIIGFQYFWDVSSYYLQIDLETVLVTNPTLKYCKITFNSNGGSNVAPIRVIAGASIAQPEDPTNGEFVFCGWFKDEELTDPFEFGYGNDNVSTDVTLYAKWGSLLNIAETFPDETLAEILSGPTYDTDSDGKLSPAEIEEIYSLDVSYSSVKSLAGIENLSGLTNLFCSYTDLTRLDVSQNRKLQLLSCSSCSLQELSIENNTELVDLGCAGNQLTTLDTSHNEKLSVLSCSNNSLTSLSLSNNKSLTQLICDNNKLTELDLTNNTEISYFMCHGNQISTINLSGVEALNKLVTEKSHEQSAYYDKNNRIRYYYDWADYSTYPSKYITVDTGTELITNPPQSYLKVYFNSNGGSPVPSYSVFSGSKICAPIEPTRSGAIFVGWYKDSNLTDPFEFGSNEDKITQETTLYAKWIVSVVIDATFFPDETFREYVANTFDSDKNGVLDLQEIGAVSQIDVTGLGISSLSGIEVFVSLKSLVCTANDLTALDVRSNKELTELWCSNNCLRELKVDKNPKLTCLSCSNNQLSELNVESSDRLTILYCADNNISSLDLSNTPYLTSASFENNPLASLDIRGNSNLNGLATQNTVNQVIVDIGGGDTQMAYYWNNLDSGYYLMVNASTRLVTSPALTYVTVTFDCNGGSETIAPMVALAGQTIIPPKNPTKLGAEFFGWCTDRAGTQGFGFGEYATPVTSDITLYAKWIEIKPEILVQPQNASAESGETTVFDVTAYGVGTLTYQWQYKGPNSSIWKTSTALGATTESVTVTARPELNGYQYRCVVTDGNGGTQNTNVVTLKVNAKITVQPANKSTTANTKVTFTVAATGAGLQYQWQYKGPGSTVWKISGAVGATTATVTVTARPELNGYQYRCVVTDVNDNTLNSNAVTLKVNAQITTQPANKTTTANSKVTFTVVAAGPGLKYQWQYKGPNSSIWKTSGAVGATTATVTVTARPELNGYHYRCIITDANGNTLNSNGATLKVNAQITTQPVNKTTTANSKITFSVAATGPALKYQWQYKGPNSSIWKTSGAVGATTSTVTVTARPELNGYLYRCVVTDANGNTLNSNVATLKVASQITSQPANKTTTANSKVTFTVAATGPGLKYQWQYKGPNSSIWKTSGAVGATTATVTVTARPELNGYHYRCVITDANGNTLNSNVAMLKVNPKITVQPVSKSSTANTKVTFTVGAEGTGLQYQWQYKGPNSSVWKTSTATGATTANVVVTARTSLAGYQYRCIITDSNGNQLVSNAVTLTVK